ILRPRAVLDDRHANFGEKILSADLAVVADRRPALTREVAGRELHIGGQRELVDAALGTGRDTDAVLGAGGLHAVNAEVRSQRTPVDAPLRKALLESRCGQVGDRRRGYAAEVKDVPRHA